MGNGSSSRTSVCSFEADKDTPKEGNAKDSKTSGGDGAPPPSGSERRLSLKRNSKVCPIIPSEQPPGTSINNNPSNGDGDKNTTTSLETENTVEGYMSCVQLFNLLFDGQNSPYIYDTKYLLLIDTRPLERYEESHIVTAKHFSTLENRFLIGNLQEYVNIVLYSDEGQIGFHDVSLTDGQMHFTSAGIDSSILIGGYDQFRAKFPFLCSNKFIHSEDDRQENLTIYPSIILDGCLYQGRGDQATNAKVVKDLNITHIVNITQEHKSAFPDTIQYLTLRLDDESNTDLGNTFPKIIEFIENALAGDGQVLVHCNLGVSRSSAATISYLMHSRKCSLQDAHDFVRNQRPVCKPNRGFLKQLSQFEKGLFGRQITDIDDIWL